MFFSTQFESSDLWQRAVNLGLSLFALTLSASLLVCLWKNWTVRENCTQKFSHLRVVLSF